VYMMVDRYAYTQSSSREKQNEDIQTHNIQYAQHILCVGPDFWRFHIHIRSTHTVIGARADITKERTKIEHKNTSISTRQ
jgi:hypothetical protein